jgi:hypothetical protein
METTLAGAERDRGYKKNLSIHSSLRDINRLPSARWNWHLDAL